MSYMISFFNVKLERVFFRISEPYLNIQFPRGTVQGILMIVHEILIVISVNVLIVIILYRIMYENVEFIIAPTTGVTIEEAR